MNTQLNSSSSNNKGVSDVIDKLVEAKKGVKEKVNDSKIEFGNKVDEAKKNTKSMLRNGFEKTGDLIEKVGEKIEEKGFENVGHAVEKLGNKIEHFGE